MIRRVLLFPVAFLWLVLLIIASTPLVFWRLGNAMLGETTCFERKLPLDRWLDWVEARRT